MTVRFASSPTSALRWLPVVLLLAAFVVHLPTLGAPLVERHPFRQTQTAYTARLFHEDRIDLLHPRLPILGPPWEVPFEFPLFQAVAALVMDVGVPEDTAMRLTGLASFVLAAGLLWLLVRGQAGWLGATVALTVFLFAPLGLMWGRAALIEYTALAACLGFALSGLRWRAGGSVWWFALALVLGCVATMVKITTAAFWVAPFVVLATRRDDEPQTRRTWAGALALSIAPLLAGLAWTRHADGIKAASEATAWLTSGALASWNFGTPAQRLDPGAWAMVGTNAILLTSGIALVALAYPAVRFALAERQLRFWAWIVLSVAGPILAFFNLYVVHDYYAIAVSASVAALVGLGVAGLPLVRTWLRAVLLTAAGLAAAVIWTASSSYWTRIYDPASDPEGVLPLAAQIERETSPGQRIAIVGRDWTPELLYYAHRWGLMVTGRESPPVDLDDLERAGYVVYICPWGPRAERCERVGPMSQGVPVLGATFGPVTGRTGLLASGT